MTDDAPQPPKGKRPKRQPMRPTATASGGHTACTPEVTEAIARRVEQLVPFKYACEAEGISRTSGQAWLAKGESGEQPYADFLQAITRAHARGVAGDVERVGRGVSPTGKPDWKAPAQRLKWADQDAFGDKVEVSVKAQDEAMLHVLQRAREILDPEVYPGAFAALLGGLRGEGSGEPDGARRDH